MNNDFPRLFEEPTAPPPTLKFPGDQANAPTREPDSIARAEQALENAQRALDTLDELTDQMIIPFPGRDAGDDDGPRAA